MPKPISKKIKLEAPNPTIHGLFGLSLDGFIGSPFKIGATVKNCPSDFQNALGMLFIGFRAWLHPENFTFVDYQLAILTAKDLKPIQGSRRRSFEIHTAPVKTAAVARTLKFIFCREPARRAAQVRTLGEQRINPIILANNPNPVVLFVLFADFSEGVVGWQSHLQYRWGLKENSGERRANETKQSG